MFYINIARADFRLIQMVTNFVKKFRSDSVNLLHKSSPILLVFASLATGYGVWLRK